MANTSRTPIPVFREPHPADMAGMVCVARTLLSASFHVEDAKPLPTSAQKSPGPCSDSASRACPVLPKPRAKPRVQGAKRRPSQLVPELNIDAASRRRFPAFASCRPEATTSPHTLPEFLALLGRHASPALRHAPAEPRTAEPPAPNAPEQDPAQRQNPKRLPEGDQAPAEQRR
jgi:hypothetical protein